MRQSQSLASLHSALQYRLKRLELLAIGGNGQNAVEKRRTAAYVAIELHNCWSGFIRSHYLSVMFGATNLVGLKVFANASPPPADPKDAIQLASQFVHARGEPHWFAHDIYRRIAVNFGFSNLVSIDTAFGYQTTFFKLATVRNYFAHKNHGSALKVATLRHQIFASPPTCPGSLLLDVIAPASPPLVREWIHDARTMGTLILS